MEAEDRTPPNIGLIARGFAMGIAEVLPGISGGTVALITGIYEPLVRGLAQMTMIVTRAARMKPLKFDEHAEALKFLLTLALGMLFGLFVGATAVVWSLEVMPTLIWGVIFGIVLTAVFPLARAIAIRDLMAFAPLGFLLACILNLLPLRDEEPAFLLIYAGGALAFAAWMLPGVSGSFVLLLIGVWAPILAAIANFKWLILTVFALGIATGWLLIANLVRHLLEYYKSPMIGVFSGLLLGSLWRLWPWQLDDAPILPWTSPVDAAYEIVLPGILLGILLVSVPNIWTRVVK